jgi:hypothetical protein
MFIIPAMIIAAKVTPCSVVPGVAVLDVQDCNLTAVFLVAVSSFLDDSQDDVMPCQLPLRPPSVLNCPSFAGDVRLHPLSSAPSRAGYADYRKR